MKTSQKGFTLVELVVVIVLLGILGVTALGKYQDLSGQAEAAALDGIASELAAASAINFANSSLTANTSGTWVAAGILPIANGTDCATGTIEGLFQTGNFPNGYTSAGTAGVCASGETTTCTITQTASTNTVDVEVICTGAATP